MAESYGLFDGQSIPAEAFRRMHRAIMASGVADNLDNELAVTAGPGRAVTVNSGLALVLGGFYYNSAGGLVKSIAANNSGQTRIDRVIVMLNLTGGTQLGVPTNTVGLTILEGTPGAGAPALTQTSTRYELSLAQVQILNGASTVTVTDERVFAGPGLHDLVAGHTATGLTSGQVLRATAASSFAFGALQNSDLFTALAWQTWTPTLQQGAASATLSITEARWAQIGKLVIARCRCAITNAGSAGNEMAFGGLPAPIRTVANEYVLGIALYFDTGTAFYTGVAAPVDTTTVKVYAHSSAGAWGNTPNFAFANGDAFSLELAYEVN